MQNSKNNLHYILMILYHKLSWGTNPGMTCDVTDSVPSPEDYAKGDLIKRKVQKKHLNIWI